MCGILGVQYKYTNMNEREIAVFDDALKALSARGRSIYTYNESTKSRFGYLRLPTDGIGEDTSNMIKNEQYPILLYNGILNQVEDMQKKAGLPEDMVYSDHEVFRLGLQTVGSDFLSKCRGMFAIAYVTDDLILLARDTIGIKPLYYVFENDMFVFASEMKALLPYSPHEIHEVLPGECIIFDREKFSLSKNVFTYSTHGEVVDFSLSHLEHLLYEALVIPTQRYLQSSTKNLGMLVSGGLDSSILCALLQKYLTKEELQRVRYFSVGTSDSSDRKYVSMIAEHYGIDVTILDPYTDEVSLREISRIIYLVESPYARVAKAALLQDVLAKTIRDADIDVLISGEGADELYFGYDKFINGLTDDQVENVYDTFFSQMFHRTLLQRFDRVFASRCIEGRVPFLDQAVVAYSRSLPIQYKIQRENNTLVTKVALRLLAKHLQIPSEIVARTKITMTKGSTNYENRENDDGYLEASTQANTAKSIKDIVHNIYLTHYGMNGSDRLAGGQKNIREEEMQMVERCKLENSNT
jgi:asparagine synthase (glutamine-hydrolysing)